MKPFPNKYIILCFNMNDIIKFPWSTDLPIHVKRKIVARGSKSDFFLKRFVELQIAYPDIHFLLCGDEAEKVVSSIFKRVVEYYAEKS